MLRSMHCVSWLARPKTLLLGLNRPNGFLAAFVHSSVQLTQTRKPWTPAEDDLLTRLKREGSNWNTIGAELGRTLPSVKSRWRNTLASRVPEALPLYNRRLTADEKGAIINQMEEGRSIGDIAKDLGRRKKVVQRYISKLGSDGKQVSFECTSETLNLVERMRSQGKQTREIAAYFGLEPASFDSRLKYHNRHIRAVRKAEQSRMIRELHDAHASVPEIAVKTGMSPAYVKRCIARVDGSILSPQIARAWSEHDWKILAELYNAGRSRTEIATSMSRTLSAVIGALQRARSKNRISVSPRANAKPFSHAEFVTIVHLRQDERLPWTAIATRLDRLSESIRMAYKRWQQDGTMTEYLRTKNLATVSVATPDV